jgi:membrane peptidoglycan carboxypeptidase
MLLGKRLYTVLMFVMVSILGGVLMAGLLVPIVGIAASSSRDAVASVNDLPTELEAPPQWERSKLLSSDNKVLAYFYDQNRVYVSLDHISQAMRMAQVGIEDHRFYEHGALDLTGTMRALVSTSQGNTQGGSSLTQQYVRMVLVEKAEASNDEAAIAAAKENTVARKVRELRYAIAVEKQFSKDQILEFYLNMAYYGDGAYGVEAAARHYFGVSAANLDLAQSAMLAGLVRNPVATNPKTHTVAAIERRNNVLDRLAELGLITSDEDTAAKAVGFDTSKVTDSRTGCANSEFAFVCQYSLNALVKNTPSLGSTETERLQRVYRGGLTIKTQIDTAAQRVAQKAISKVVSGKDPVISVVTMIEPGTGLIKAMAQSRPQMGSKKGQTYYNYAVDSDMGGADGFQGGSTFKLFVAAAALENGFGVNTTYQVQRSRDYKGEVFPTCDDSGPWPSKWVVDGSASEVGSYNLLRGTAQSVNNYYVPLEQAVGVCTSVKMAQRVGLKMANGQDLVATQGNYPSFTLGAVEVTPLSLTNAYATFANRGIHCDPVILQSITTSDNTSLAVPSANCQRVVSQGVADAVNKVFQTPYESSYGGTLSSANISGYTLAGKTGTVPGNKAEWTVAYTPDLVTSAVISYDNNGSWAKYWKSHPGFLKGLRLPVSGTVVSGFGSDVGRRIVAPAIKKALDDLDKHTAFSDPPASVLNGDTVTVPTCTNLSITVCQKELKNAGFRSYIKKTSSATVAAGSIIGLTETGKAGKGVSIGILVSTGVATAPVNTTPTPKK